MVTNAGCTGILEKMLTSKGSGRQKAALAALGVMQSGERVEYV